MTVRGDAASITEKWKQRTSGATQQVIDGIRRVNEAPGRKAAAQKSVYLANVTQAVDKWARNTEAVSLEEWRAATEAGASRIAAGVQAKAGKMESFLRDFIPHLEAGQRKIGAMPRGSIEQNIARMVENVRHNAQFRRTSR